MHEDITVLISSSPIESHPSTTIIEETIASIRYHLPRPFIKIMCDGVRPEQEAKREDYAEYFQRLPVGNGVMLTKMMEFCHQALMTMCVLDTVTSPLVLYCEQDTPLLERPIDLEMLKDKVLAGETNHIRLHYDEQIHPDHEHLMCGKLTDNLIKTRQFHNRPYLTRTDWFKQLLNSIFNKDSRSFIEDRVYSFVEQAPWEDYRCTIYDPNGDGKLMKRSGHTNGRGSEPKYSMTF